MSIFPIQTHNALFAAGVQTYFLRVNQFADRTMEEIRSTSTGLGLLSSDPASLAPSQVTRGRLPVNYNSPRTVDTEQAGQPLLMTSNLRTGTRTRGSIINYLAGKKRPDTIIATATMDIRVVFLS